MSLTQGEDTSTDQPELATRLGPALLYVAGYAGLRNTRADQPAIRRMRGCYLVRNGYIRNVAPPSDGEALWLP